MASHPPLTQSAIQELIKIKTEKKINTLLHSFVFSFRSKPLARILSTGWRQARIKTSLQHVRVHDLKHTFGRRLRAAGVSFEDRQDLLGHRSGRITTHYSSAELQSLYDAANKVCEKQNSRVILTLLRNPSYKKSPNTQTLNTGHAKVTQKSRKDFWGDQDIKCNLSLRNEPALFDGPTRT